MGDVPMQRYHRLPGNRDYSDSSNMRLGQCEGVLELRGYTIRETLGQGSFGTVFLVNNTDEDPYVIKQMSSRDKNELQVLQEVTNLKDLNHGYIVSYVDSFEDVKCGYFYIVMEYCEGGDLFKKMKTQKDNGIFKEQEIIDWLVQICLALQYLHKKNILHRDIKPQNIFLTEDGYINLGDFGCSKAMQRADVYAESVVGADLYVSPEVFRKRYNYKSDIWSLGWVLHDLCMLDEWEDIIQRRLLHSLSMTGSPPHISEQYSEDLRELIRQMLSCNPKDRPSANEILAKPFLNDALKRNKRLPEALERRFRMSFKSFDEAYNEHYKAFEALVNDWETTTNSIEMVHYNSTAGALSGSVIGAAGGITAVVGAILAPFTFGASLIVTGVGIGVGVAGGVGAAASNIINAVNQKSLRDSLENIKKKYGNVSEPILIPLNTMRKIWKKIRKFSDFICDSTFENVQISWNVDKSEGARPTHLMNLGLLANVSRFAAQTAKAGRVAAAAVSGVISGLLVIVDVTFIVKDSQEIHQMRQNWKTDDPEKVKSSVLKSIAEMRKTHTDLCNVLKGIKETREYALKEMARMEPKKFK